jgi:hypothetical protein
MSNHMAALYLGCSPAEALSRLGSNFGGSRGRAGEILTGVKDVRTKANVATARVGDHT